MENLKSLQKLAYPDSQTLLPYQIESVHKMLNFLTLHGCVYNASEMGLGKSIQTIVCLNSLSRLKAKKLRTLIVCPAVMKHVWVNELKAWQHPYTSNSVKIIEHASQIRTSNMYEYSIISYGLIDKVIKELPFNASLYFDVLVLDEAHYIKNTEAKRSKAILTHIWPKCTYKIALSGTPFTNNVVDGWTVFSKMHPKAFSDYWQFVRRYTHIKYTPWGMKPEGLKNHEELSKIIRENFYIRYLKKDVLTELPDKVHQTIYVPGNFAIKESPQEKLLNEEYAKALREALSHNSYKLPSPPVSIMERRKNQGMKKLPFVIDYINEFLLQDIPVVVFGIHREFLTALSLHFQKYKPAVIVGDTKAKDRQDAVERFQSGFTPLFLGNLIAAGVGITLTASSHVVIAELDFIPSTISQAIARCHRIGQKDTVNVHYLVTVNSLEEKILPILIKKQSEFNKVLDYKAA